MKRNLKKEINEMIDEKMPDIQTNFIDGKLNDEGRQIVTMITNQALNLVRRCENDYRELTSETFFYNDKDLDVFKEKEIISYVSTKIYMQLEKLNKAPNEFLGISKNDDDSFYNWKRHDSSKFVRYVDDFREEEGLVPLEITPDELYSVCTRKTVNFENLFHYYYSDKDLSKVIKQLFDEKFHRCSNENQEYLISWCEAELKKRAKTNIQREKVEEFFQNKIRYTDTTRAMQMIIDKIIENDIKNKEK